MSARNPKAEFAARARREAKARWEAEAEYLRAIIGRQVSMRPAPEFGVRRVTGKVVLVEERTEGDPIFRLSGDDRWWRFRDLTAFDQRLATELVTHQEAQAPQV